MNRSRPWGHSRSIARTARTRDSGAASVAAGPGEVQDAGSLEGTAALALPVTAKLGTRRRLQGSLGRGLSEDHPHLWSLLGRKGEGANSHLGLSEY